MYRCSILYDDIDGICGDEAPTSLGLELIGNRSLAQRFRSLGVFIAGSISH
jgi:hypothetical protein